MTEPMIEYPAARPARAFAAACESAVDRFVEETVDHDRAEVQTLGFHLVDKPARLAKAIGLGGGDQHETHGWRAQQRGDRLHPGGDPFHGAGGGGEEVGDGRERVAAGEALQLARDVSS